jgi:integrase
MEAVLEELIETVSADPDTPPSTADLTTAGITRWMALACPHRSPNTVIGLLGYVRAVASHAADEGLIDRQPSWRRLRPRRTRPAKVRHHPAHQVAALLEHLEAGAQSGAWTCRRLHALVSLVAYTGLRRDEALWLRRRDLHLPEGYIEVEPHHRRQLKTLESGQPVPVPPELRPILEAWLPEIPAHRPWVIPALRSEGPWHGGGPGRRPIDHLKAAGGKVGIEGLTWRTLRASWATHAESLWGCTEEQIMRVLRQTSPETSRRHYRQADLDNLRAIGARVSYRA